MKKKEKDAILDRTGRLSEVLQQQRQKEENRLSYMGRKLYEKISQCMRLGALFFPDRVLGKDTGGDDHFRE